MDDIVIYSGSVEEHDGLFREVLKRLKDNKANFIRYSFVRRR